MKYLYIFLLLSCANTYEKSRLAATLNQDMKPPFEIIKKEIVITPSGRAYGASYYALAIEFKENLKATVTIDSIIYNNTQQTPNINGNKLNCLFKIYDTKHIDADFAIAPTNKKTPNYQLNNNQALLFYNSGETYLINDITLTKSKQVPR